MQAADYEQALEAVREWYAMHGRLPQPREWERAARGRPTTRTIRRRRLGWDQLMIEATGQDAGEAMDEEAKAVREFDVARLVAEGLTNRAIAERLHLSSRTAENHVQHVLDKLGFDSRSQIAAWFAARKIE